jgi:hypothetical protein
VFCEVVSFAIICHSPHRREDAENSNSPNLARGARNYILPDAPGATRWECDLPATSLLLPTLSHCVSALDVKKDRRASRGVFREKLGLAATNPTERY